MVKKTFKTPLYGTEFTVIIYQKDSEINDFFKGHKFEPPITDFDCGLLDYKDKLYVLLYSGKKGYPTAGTIAHESKHLVNRIFIDICHPLCRYQDEPECYLLGWIVNRIHELKNKLHNGSNK